MSSYGLNSDFFHQIFTRETVEIVIKLYEARDKNESRIKPELASINLNAALRKNPKGELITDD